MIRLKDTHFQTTNAFLESAINVAEYYGFSPLESISRAPRALSTLTSNTKDSDIAFARRDERTLPSAARKCLACVRPPHGTLLAWRTVNSSTSIPGTSLELHVMGAGSTITEALLIVVANAISEEAGIKQRVLSINNVGAPDSSNRYVRDVGIYLRKHIESISPTLRPRIATDPLGTLVQLIERGHPAVPRAPQSMEYLTEEERRRFWELLEYLEVFGIPYELSGQILGSRDCWAHSLFGISTLDGETGAPVPIAFGGRYDPLATRFAQSPTNAAMMSMTVEMLGTSPLPVRPVPSAPVMYFAYLGAEARRRALTVLEILRHAEIPVHQGLWYEKMADQMNAAQVLATPYILIMGHKEALGGTVIVRELATNSQDDVPLDHLPNYLKRHHIGNYQLA